MKRKIALKRLSASDLTLFEHHFRNTSGTKQKAFNLDASIFVNRLYPGLPDSMDITRDRIPLDLHIYGPGKAGLQNLQRKILKQKKNWRLDGEFISNPYEDEQRYNSLQKGDFAIIEFMGGPEPQSARMHLVAQALAEDRPLFEALHNRYSGVFSPRKGMTVVNPEELSGLIEELAMEDGHPVLDLVDMDALEDAVQGGIEGTRRLGKRRRARGVSRDEFDKARRNAERIGNMGEELLNLWLEAEQEKGAFSGFRWDSAGNAISPFDFSIVEMENIVRKIDAKSTSGDFRNPVHVSMAEMLEMTENAVPYDIYRLYRVKPDSAKMRIAENVGAFTKAIVETLKSLPAGVRADGFSIEPERLDFGDEITIAFPDSEGDE